MVSQGMLRDRYWNLLVSNNPMRVGNVKFSFTTCLLDMGIVVHKNLNISTSYILTHLPQFIIDISQTLKNQQWKFVDKQ